MQQSLVLTGQTWLEKNKQARMKIVAANMVKTGASAKKSCSNIVTVSKTTVVGVRNTMQNVQVDPTEDIVFVYTGRSV